MNFQRWAVFRCFFSKKVAIFEKKFFFVWHQIDTMKIHIFVFYNFLSDNVCGQQSQNSILHVLRGHKIEKFISPPRGALARKIFWLWIRGRYTYKMSHLPFTFAESRVSELFAWFTGLLLTKNNGYDIVTKWFFNKFFIA